MRSQSKALFSFFNLILVSALSAPAHASFPLYASEPSDQKTPPTPTAPQGDTLVVRCDRKERPRRLQPAETFYFLFTGQVSAETGRLDEHKLNKATLEIVNGQIYDTRLFSSAENAVAKTAKGFHVFELAAAEKRQPAVVKLPVRYASKEKFEGLLKYGPQKEEYKISCATKMRRNLPILLNGRRFELVSAVHRGADANNPKKSIVKKIGTKDIPAEGHYPSAGRFYAPPKKDEKVDDTATAEPPPVFVDESEIVTGEEDKEKEAPQNVRAFVASELAFADGLLSYQPANVQLKYKFDLITGLIQISDVEALGDKNEPTGSFSATYYELTFDEKSGILKLTYSLNGTAVSTVYTYKIIGQ